MVNSYYLRECKNEELFGGWVYSEVEKRIIFV